MRWRIEPVAAEWDTFGRAAGPIRNQSMIDMAPDLVLAFHNDMDHSRGTVDTVDRAIKAGINVEVITT
jgi:hypothetical protein